MSSSWPHSGYLTNPQPGRLQELQTEIFRQLQLLIPDQIAHYDSFKSQVQGSPLLRMDILERHPYTHFVRLTYQFNRDESLEIAPDAHIRVYNDARLAEATSFDHVQGFERRAHTPAYLHSPAPGQSAASTFKSPLPDRSTWLSPFQVFRLSWRKNQALDKWLSYLLHQGHSLTTMQATRNRISGKQAIPVKEPSRSA